VLGHAIEFRRDPVGLLRRGQRQLGDVFDFRLPGTRVTALVGPSAQAAFFNAGDDVLSAREVYQFTVPIFGKGVVYDVGPAELDQQMGFLFPALRDERLRVYARVMEEEAEAYVDGWGDAGEIDLPVAMNELTVFIATRCLIGAEMRQRVSAEIAHLYHDLEGGISLLAFLNPYLPLPAFRRRDRARVRIAELIGGVIADRRRRGTAGDDFLETLMSARDARGVPLTDDIIIGLLLATIFAGQHTSAVMATWTGVLLLEHPRWLPGVLAEQREVFGDVGAGMSLEALRRLVALEHCIKEAERMHPPLIMLMRRIATDFEHAGFVAPAGGMALVSPAAAHRLPTVFAEPDRYDPDRFGTERQEDRRIKHALIGFGGGHHRCIGSIFAQQQIKVIWSVLLRRFELELVDHDRRPDYTTFVVGPQLPCRLRYRRRRPLTVAASASAETLA
jgi:sterol 14-demethylase